jgi:hypothetical protein
MTYQDLVSGVSRAEGLYDFGLFFSVSAITLMHAAAHCLFLHSMLKNSAWFTD